MINLFDLNNKLLLGSFVTQIKEFADFTFTKTIFTGNIYNLIFPMTSLDNFDWEESEKVRAEQKALGFEFSYYINDQVNPGFSEYLLKNNFEKTFSDQYVFKEISEHYTDISCKYEIVSDQNFVLFKDISKKCFPGWTTNEEFCTVLFNTQNKNNENKCVNIIAYLDEIPVGIGAVIYSTSLNLAYITNTCVLPDFRNQGIHKDLTKYLYNFCLEKGITRFYALVEPDSVSYKNFIKLGFDNFGLYDLYFK